MVHGQWARQDADLSHMNQPAIRTMLLVAGFSDLTKHYLSWTQLDPPQECMDRLFVTPDNVTIDQQVDKLTEVRERSALLVVVGLPLQACDLQQRHAQLSLVAIWGGAFG
jgi:hypothetical protein